MTGERRDAGTAVDGVIAALADPTRRELLDLLAAAGELERAGEGWRIQSATRAA